ncbi:MAG TPA: zinc-binding dehydrogenase, partial [Caulobacteraceae bacterium]|nr:zinc-binding dehydrogenase [Caulobacteraceae bacterium]
MADGNQGTGLQLRSLVKDGQLQLSLAQVPIPTLDDDEILVRVGASPINPSDLGLLLGPADLSTASVSGSGDAAVLTAKIAPQFARMVAPREGQSLPVGNEGAGVVVDAGAGAKQLVGKTVAILGGAMYAQYRAVKAADALVLHDDATPKDGASCFVNPLTALGMVGTMRLEGHSGLVHTAAASNLGQMLVKICRADGVPLVNIVRSPAQSALLKGLGAEHVVDSSQASFMDDLIAALDATGATLAFDAIGGGKLAGQILTGMEIVAARK